MTYEEATYIISNYTVSHPLYKKAQRFLNHRVSRMLEEIGDKNGKS